MIRFIKDFVQRVLNQIFSLKKEFKLGLYGPPNGGKCVTPETKIVMQNGKIKEIGHIFNEITKGKTLPDSYKEVLFDIRDQNLIVPTLDTKNLKITPKKITHIYSQKYEENIYKIKTRNGREIKATFNHPLIRISDNGVEDIKCGHLKVGDSVALSKNLTLSSTIELPSISQEIFNLNNGLIQAKSKFHHTKEITAPTFISEELVRFVAYTIAEAQHTKNRIKFSNSNKDILKDYIYLTKKLFNLDFILREREGSYEVDIGSKTLVDYLKDVLGLNPGKSHIKKIPDQFMGLTNNMISSLLRVLFDCEGYIPNRKGVENSGKYLEFTSKSKILVEQVQLLLNRFGIVGKIIDKHVNGEVYWRLLISGSDQHRLFRDFVGVSIDYKKERLDELCKAKLKRNKFSLPIVNLLENIRKEEGKTQEEFFLDNKHVARMRKENRITYHRLEKIAKKSNNNFIKKVANADVLWDEIISIKKEKYNNYVYDITVEDSHTFLLSNGLIAHNSTLANRIAKDWLGEKMSTVSSIPHETRNVNIKEKIVIKSRGKELTFNLVDTPGISTKIDYEDFLKHKMSKAKAKKRAKEATKGVVEAIKWLDDMDCVVVVLDSTQNPYNQVNITIIGNLVARKIPVLIVANKVDLKKADIKKIENAFPQYEVAGISALKGKNMEEFYESLFKLVK